MKKLGSRQYAWLAFAGITSLAVARVIAADSGAAQRALSPAERRELGRTAAQKEPSWRASAQKTFPGDDWSQDDDFQKKERDWVGDRSAALGVSPAQIFRAIDEDLHAHSPTPPRKANASPCKPRPFYD